jgi:threonine synthase
MAAQRRSGGFQLDPTQRACSDKGLCRSYAQTFIAAHRDFAEMERLGFIPKRPLMAAAQAARASAITKMWQDRAAIVPLKIGYTVAAGSPGRKCDWVLRILRETGGAAGPAEDEEIVQAQKMLARTQERVGEMLLVPIRLDRAN